MLWNPLQDFGCLLQLVKLTKYKKISVGEPLAQLQLHHVSQGNGPVPLQVGVRITSKSTNLVLCNSSSF